MRRLLSTAAVILLAIGTIVVGGSALAYFSSEGAGSAHAAVTKLTAPTITATTVTGSAISLTWSAVTAPGAGMVRYYVTRDGGEPASTCATAVAPQTAIKCTDASLAIGEHTYTVTATWETWTAVSGAKTAKTTVGPATQFTIAASSTTLAAGATTNLTITARDANGATDASYTGSHSLVFDGASPGPGGHQPTVDNSSDNAISFGNSTALNFTAGVATVTSSRNGVLRIYNSGQAEITASEGSMTTPQPLVVTVTPGTATKFVLTATTTSPTAGAANGLTITAQDTYSNTATAYTGSRSLIFSGASSSPGGSIPTITNSSGAEVAFGSATAIAFDAGVASAAEGDGGVTRLYKSGSTSLKATQSSVITPTALTVTVAAGEATKLVLSNSTSTPSATSTSNLTTTAQDVYGNTASSYAGLKDIVFSGASPSPNGTAPTIVNSAGTTIAFGSATALNFTSGVASVSSGKNGLMRLPKAGATSISASDGSIVTASPLALTVAVGSAKQLGFTSLTASAGTIGSPCLFTCAITGLGNSGTVTANVSVTDTVGNTVSGLGSGHAVKVTANGGSVSGGTLSIATSGPAVSTTQFTYTAPASGSFSNTITATKSSGTTYTSATATVK
jgi:hypothetical protein